MYGRSNTSNSLHAQRAELGQRRRQHLHRAQLQRLHLLLVLVQRAVRIDLDLDPALGALLGQLLEALGALALGRVDGDDVAELDDDRRLRSHGGLPSDRGQRRPAAMAFNFMRVSLNERIFVDV